MSSCGQDGLLLTWNTQKGCRNTFVQLPSQFAMMSCIAPDGGMAAAAGLNNVIHLYKVEGKECKFLYDMEGHDGYVPCANFINGGKNIISCSGDSNLAFWDVNKKDDAVYKLEDHAADVGGVDSSPDGNTFCSCSNDSTVKFWDGRSKECTGTVRFTEGAELSKVRFIPGSTTTAAVSVAGEGKGKNHGKFIIVDARAMGKICSFNGTSKKNFEAMSVGWSNSGRVLFGATTDDDDPKNLMVFDVANGPDSVQKLTTGSLRTNEISVSKDGCGVAGCNWVDGDIKSNKNISVFTS